MFKVNCRLPFYSKNKEMYSEPSGTSKMKLFVNTVNG